MKNQNLELENQSLENQNLLATRLHFFTTNASFTDSLLKEFQGNQPLCPFLYEELKTLQRSLMLRFIKKDVHENVRAGMQLVK